MAKAVWNGAILAESDQVITLEGNLYFPADSLHHEYFADSPKHTTCPWKGVASYFDITVDGEVNRAAAWTYPEPSRAAAQIEDYVAFWRGVQVDA